MQFQSPIAFETGSRTFAVIENCDINILQTMFGARLSFTFHIRPNQIAADMQLIGLEGELSLEISNSRVLIGSLVSSFRDDQTKLGTHGKTVNKYLDLRGDEFVLLADRTHIGDVSLFFDLKMHILDEPYTGTPNGRLVIPHSEWLKLLARSSITRFEVIAIKVPTESSHLHKPFSLAVAKIREAEREYNKGNWNAAGACCRDAWNTVLSSVPTGTPKEKRFDALMVKVTGDPRRKAFAGALVKGMHDILNKAKHLEGDIQTQTEPADLKPEDALLCIHWYATMIGYLASV